MTDAEHFSDYVVQGWLDRLGPFAYPAFEAAHYPQIFATLVRGDFDLSLDDLAPYVGIAWSRGTQYLTRDEWRYLFEIAGYREDDDPADRPTEALLLWRGATPLHRSNWSWAARRDAALRFADSWMQQDEVGLIWRAVVEPERLMAKLTYPHPHSFSEYVVDTDGLAVEPDGLWCRCPVDLKPFRGNDLEAQVALDIHELVTCTRESLTRAR